MLSAFMLFNGMAELNAQSAQGKFSSKGAGLFTENKGQIMDRDGHPRPDILFAIEGKVFVRKNGLSYVARKIEGEDKATAENSVEDNPSAIILKTHRIDVDFVKGNDVIIKAEYPVTAYKNYYLSGCREGLTGIKSYQKLSYINKWKNIDVEMHESKSLSNCEGTGFEYDFRVKPGGNPKNIVLKYTGMSSISVVDGKLVLARGNAMNAIEEWIPKVYQNENGKQVGIQAEYILKGNEVCFKLGKYNRKKELIIDPWVTYWGGNAAEGGAPSITTDKEGSVVVIAYLDLSFGPIFPTTAGAFMTTKSPGNVIAEGDLGMVKMDLAGNLLWSTYLGGRNDDSNAGICTDDDNNIFIAGTTYSSDFPAVVQSPLTPYQSNHPTSADAQESIGFVTKFNKNGQLLWGTYFGGLTLAPVPPPFNANGPNQDGASEIDVDKQGNIYITGYTRSSDLPVMGTSPFQTSLKGTQDAFVAKFNGATGMPVWSTYFGGTSTNVFANDVGYDIAFDEVHNTVAVIGSTSSTDFPATINQLTYGGGTTDAFVACFDAASGNALWSTYYGGTGAELAMGIEADAAGNVLAAGETFSPSTIAIASGGAFQPNLSGPSDAFLVKFDPDGMRSWGTYYGGSNTEDAAGGVAVDINGNILLNGTTRSVNLPAAVNAHNGADDCYVARFAPDGTPICARQIGSVSTSNQETGHGISAFGTFANIVGTVNNNIFPTSPTAAQHNNGGTIDLFIAQVCEDCNNDPALAVPTVTPSANKTICPGTITRLTVGGGSAPYTWFPSATLTSPTGSTVFAGPTVTTTYYVYGACSSIDSVTVFVLALPTFQVDHPVTSMCLGNTADFTVFNEGVPIGTTYTWSPAINLSNTTGTFVQSTPPLEGQYSFSVTASNVNHCNYKYPFPIDITVVAIPTASVSGNISLCSGTSGTVTASGGNIYSWFPLTTMTVSGSNGEIASISPPSAGTFTYNLAVSEPVANCKDTTTFFVTAYELPLVSVNPNPVIICFPDDATLTAVSATAITYSWSPATNLNTATTAVVNFHPPTNAIYTYSLSVQDANSCENVTSVLITVDDNITVSAGSDASICAGEQTLLTATGAGIFDTYQWSPPATLSGISTAIVTANPGVTTVYHVSVVQGNCSASDSVHVTVNQLPTVTATASEDTICIYATVTLTAAGASSYTWSPTTSPVAGSVVSATPGPAGTVSYSVTGIDSNQCQSIFILNIFVNDLPAVNAGSDATINSGQSIVLNGTGGPNYHWEPANSLDNASVQNPLASPLETTTYTLTVIEPNGCDSFDLVIITVEEVCDTPFVPNSFSPNNDGQNDLLHVESGEGCAEVYSFTIFDRWGYKVFESIDPEANWNGLINNKEAEQGVFAYILSATIKGKEYHLQGNITLLK